MSVILLIISFNLPKTFKSMLLFNFKNKKLEMSFIIASIIQAEKEPVRSI